jgi:hypothetical protein
MDWETVMMAIDKDDQLQEKRERMAMMTKQQAQMPPLPQANNNQPKKWWR